MSKIALDSITADTAAQPRTLISAEKVAEYVEDMARGDKFPPLVVFKEAEKFWLADGFHRFYAARTAGMDSFEAAVREGGLREAILFSCGANARHGLRRTTSDKRRAVVKLLEDAEWASWSDGEIARHCAVSPPFVGKLRKEIAVLTQNVLSDQRLVETRHGTVATMNTAEIGRKTEDEMTLPPGRIVAGLRDIQAKIDAMPDPETAVRTFPADQWYFFPLSKIEGMADWLNAFAAEWRSQAQGRGQ